MLFSNITPRCRLSSCSVVACVVQTEKTQFIFFNSDLCIPLLNLNCITNECVKTVQHQARNLLIKIIVQFFGGFSKIIITSESVSFTRLELPNQLEAALSIVKMKIDEINYKKMKEYNQLYGPQLYFKRYRSCYSIMCNGAYTIILHSFHS